MRIDGGVLNQRILQQPNMAQAAMLLRISRSTLYRRCKDLGVSARDI
jgi:transcriptional regulator of acetoin/glycerol metabolism